MIIMKPIQIYRDKTAKLQKEFVLAAQGWANY